MAGRLTTGAVDRVGDDAVSVIFRATTPDCDAPHNLRAKLDLAGERGLRRADFTMASYIV